VLTKLRASPSLSFFKKIITQEPSLLIEKLWEGPKAVLSIFSKEASKKNLLIITGEMREDRLIEDFIYFKEKVLAFPSWETLPGEEILPSPDIVGARFDILHKLLTSSTPQIVLCPLQAILQKIPSPSTIKPLFLSLGKGDEIAFGTLEALLSSRGYKRKPVVSDKGEFTLRSGILDLFPVNSPDPFRIEFFGDVIDEIRIFDPISQKSIQKVDSLFICPADEMHLLKTEKKLSSLFDYLGNDTLLILDDLLALEDRYVSLLKMEKMSSLFLTFEDVIHSDLQKMFWSKESIEELSEKAEMEKIGRDFYTGKQPLQPVSFDIFQQKIITKRWKSPFVELSVYFHGEDLIDGINHIKDEKVEVHFVSATESEESSFRQRLTPPLSSTFDRGYLSSGFALPDIPFLLFPFTEVTHRHQIRRGKWRSSYHIPVSEFHEFIPGDLVVHFHHGIAKFLGFEKNVNHLNQEVEFLVLEYADRAKLFVPIAQSHLVSRYIGAKEEEAPSLHALGSKRWEKTRHSAQTAIIGYAQELLKRHAEREVVGGFAFPSDSDEVIQFEMEFPFTETEDQLKAIADTKKDMLSSKAMDRLICGDVGYGKTEVAMRAAFKAVIDGKKQVALLVPTTVLALQHAETFQQRMANYPITVVHLSRFSSSKETKKKLEGIKNGSIDIVIGTHRILSQDVHFKNLGLLIIDEEQRFGVRAKEHIKAVKAGVDCLYMSATPIPRTLYLSLMGAKDLSIISTPPQDRLPIKSIIAERDLPLIQNAMLRELSRDGQVFFIHNRVETIFQVAEELQKLLPAARVLVAHGQMSAEEIDSIFHQFKLGTADILVATTIVENGIDIPNANTLLVDRADQFGLADLYQLRGRVGRWNRSAYAYFLVPKGKLLPEIARKRLNATVESSGFGGGMKIAMRDLEMRGAGDILGTSQSGQVSQIGFHLYCKLLKRAIDAYIKKKPSTFFETRIEFSIDARLPEEYIDTTSLRLEIYHRLGEASSFEEVDAIFQELKDRFGTPPPPVVWLYHFTRLRIFASEHHFSHIKFENYTFTAEKKQMKKTIPLARTKNPAIFEKEVIAALEKAF